MRQRYGQRRSLKIEQAVAKAQADPSAAQEFSEIATAIAEFAVCDGAKLKGYLSKYLGSDRAEDIYQQVFADILTTRPLAAVRGGYFKSYVWKSALRLSSRARRAAAVESGRRADVEKEQAAVTVPSTYGKVETDQELSRLGEAIRSLPGLKRQIYLKRTVEGKKMAQIADELGMTRTNAKYHLGQAFKLVSAQLSSGKEKLCQDMAPLLSRSVYGDTSTLDRARLASHLAHCGHCRKERRELLTLKNKITALTPLPLLLGKAYAACSEDFDFWREIGYKVSFTRLRLVKRSLTASRRATAVTLATLVALATAVAAVSVDYLISGGKKRALVPARTSNTNQGGGVDRAAPFSTAFWDELDDATATNDRSPSDGDNDRAAEKRAVGGGPQPEAYAPASAEPVETSGKKGSGERISRRPLRPVSIAKESYRVPPRRVGLVLPDDPLSSVPGGSKISDNTTEPTRLVKKKIKDKGLPNP